jgi:hypothetical protein
METELAELDARKAAAEAALAQSRQRTHAFEGKEDGASYILELTHLLGTHEVPVAQWPRELSLKLKGPAANWYAARFPDLPAGTFPLWSELHAAMLHAYSQSYGAAVAPGPPQSGGWPALRAKRPMREWKSIRCFFDVRGSTTRDLRSKPHTSSRTS